MTAEVFGDSRDRARTPVSGVPQERQLVARNTASGSFAHALERRSRAGRHLTVTEAMQGLV
jgi:hypothetical protein